MADIHFVGAVAAASVAALTMAVVVMAAKHAVLADNVEPQPSVTNHIFDGEWHWRDQEH